MLALISLMFLSFSSVHASGLSSNSRYTGHQSIKKTPQTHRYVNQQTGLVIKKVPMLTSRQYTFNPFLMVYSKNNLSSRHHLTGLYFIKHKLVCLGTDGMVIYNGFVTFNKKTYYIDENGDPISVISSDRLVYHAGSLAGQGAYFDKATGKTAHSGFYQFKNNLLYLNVSGRPLLNGYAHDTMMTYFVSSQSQQYQVSASLNYLALPNQATKGSWTSNKKDTSYVLVNKKPLKGTQAVGNQIYHFADDTGQLLKNKTLSLSDDLDPLYGTFNQQGILIKLSKDQTSDSGDAVAKINADVKNASKADYSQTTLTHLRQAPIKDYNLADHSATIRGVSVISKTDLTYDKLSKSFVYKKKHQALSGMVEVDNALYYYDKLDNTRDYNQVIAYQNNYYYFDYQHGQLLLSFPIKAWHQQTTNFDQLAVGQQNQPLSDGFYLLGNNYRNVVYVKHHHILLNGLVKTKNILYFVSDNTVADHGFKSNLSGYFYTNFVIARNETMGHFIKRRHQTYYQLASHHLAKGLVGVNGQLYFFNQHTGMLVKNKTISVTEKNNSDPLISACIYKYTLNKQGALTHVQVSD